MAEVLSYHAEPSQEDLTAQQLVATGNTIVANVEAETLHNVLPRLRAARAMVARVQRQEARIDKLRNEADEDEFRKQKRTLRVTADLPSQCRRCFAAAS
eukprot:6278709-Lingulodinium_polyedra.AAC.1